MRLVLLLLSLLLAAPSAPALDREGFVVTDDGARLHYRVEGQGPETLVVVHGGPANSMESIRPDFAPATAGRRIIYYDQRGNGGSSLDMDPARLAIGRHVADLEAIRAHFGLQKMNLLGNSWGGLLVSYYAVAHPDRVARLVLHDPAPPARPWLEAMSDEIRLRSRALPEAERRAFGAASDPLSWYRAPDPLVPCRTFMQILFRLYAYDIKAPGDTHSDPCAGGPEAVRRQLIVNKRIWAGLPDYDIRPQLGRVTAPVLILYGEADPVPRAAAEAWAAGYPNARLLVVRHAGHLSHVEQPAVFFAALDTFLRGHWPAEALTVAER
ncbi:MAG TPA: alpha/beta hydrolase [Allosphingosinicella sp.]|jgi:proline iminopeptidase|nr:alpha/beta hydrolase [Allosphingosinicella sp.]